ncbi:MAG: hypothetical protein LC633_05100 [Desulfobulbaceae bacterium]|nr:hypothetical protein [Desulfobulbaceae bacterium]
MSIFIFLLLFLNYPAGLSCPGGQAVSFINQVDEIAGHLEKLLDDDVSHNFIPGPLLLIQLACQRVQPGEALPVVSGMI